MRLISEDTIQIGFHDSTNYIKEEINDGKLFEYFTDLQKVSNTAISLRIGDYVKISPEIYDILEISDEIEYDFTDSPIYNYTLPGEDLKIRRVLNSLSDNKTGKCIYNVQSGKGNLKFLKTIFNVRYHNNEKIILGFTQDITDIVQSQKDAIQVKNDFKFTNDAHNIVLVESENNEYNYTSQIYKILNIKPEDYPNTVPLIHEFAIPEDKEKFNKLFINLTPKNNVLDKIIRVKDNEGNLKYIYCQNKGVFDDEGNITQYIGLMLDITEETLSQKSAMTLKKNLERIQDVSKIVIISYKNNELSYTDEIYIILEINPEDRSKNIDLVQYFTSKEDRKVLKEKLHKLSPTNNTFESYNEIFTHKNNIKILHTFVDGRFTNEGELESIVGLVQDVTIAYKREKKLEQLVEDKKILLQEVHHRVKNNLQLILSFLNLEDRYNHDDPDYVINQVRNRIRTMALTHEEVYNSPSVSEVDMNSFITKDMTNLFRLYTDGNIKLNFNIEHIMLNMEDIIPLGLFINELALNTIKYAFPNKEEGNFYISFKKV